MAAMLSLLGGIGVPARVPSEEIRPIFDQEVARFKSLAASPHAEFRIEAAQGFGLMRHHVGEDALLPLARDPDPDVRWAAIEALGHCGMRRAIEAQQRELHRKLKDLLSDDAAPPPEEEEHAPAA